MRSRLQIAEELLGHPLEDGEFAPCPGRDLHSKGSNRREFRIRLDGAPTAFCFHQSCSDKVEEFNRELRRRIWFEENPRGRREDIPAAWGGDAIAAAPKGEAKKRPPINQEKVDEICRRAGPITPDWLRRRSPIDPVGVGPQEFLEALLNPGERVLIFTSLWTQGCFGYEVGRGGFRLSQDRHVRGVKSALPLEGREGIWWLVQPVSGQWMINPKALAADKAKYTRRSDCNVTRWLHYVLEGDELPPEQWLPVLATLPLPICAAYTSGGRSVHALIRSEVPSKPEWDQQRDVVRQVVCPLGADPAALTAVRLSRLPGCMRLGTAGKDGRYHRYDAPQKQRLLYLDPAPSGEPLLLRRELR
ncbi:MAG: hypothetical protein JSR82_24505 [Verrucomicrobia bacterium]|nr:hypothetical protein [Verrucomicrobiota bacterium]